jgi:hypothetical protein
MRYCEQEGCYSPVSNDHPESGFCDKCFLSIVIDGLKCELECEKEYSAQVKKECLEGLVRLEEIVREKARKQ